MMVGLVFVASSLPNGENLISFVPSPNTFRYCNLTLFPLGSQSVISALSRLIGRHANEQLTEVTS